jgi:hypothetical protein
VQFEYQVEGSVDATHVANVFEIYSISLGKVLMSFYLEPNSNQIGVDYLGTNVIKYGPTATFSFNTFAKFKLDLTDTGYLIFPSFTKLINQLKLIYSHF